MPYVITADKTEIYYKDWGKGRPIVLLHGWPLSSDSWEDQALAFANAEDTAPHATFDPIACLLTWLTVPPRERTASGTVGAKRYDCVG